MTLQEIFQTSATRLLEQNKPSISNNTCQFFSDDGTSCAVGLLFIDQPELAAEIKERYNRCSSTSLLASFEGARRFLGISTDEPEEFYCSSDEAESATFRKVKLLRDLQNVHDHSDPKCWRENLINLAHFHNLDASFLQTATA